MLTKIFLSFLLLITITITDTALAGANLYIDNNYKSHYFNRYTPVSLVFTWADQEDIDNPSNLLGTVIPPLSEFHITGKTNTGYYVTVSLLNDPTVFVQLMITNYSDGYKFDSAMSNGNICATESSHAIKVNIQYCENSPQHIPTKNAVERNPELAM